MYRSLLQHNPGLQDESIQILVFVVGPLLLVLLTIIIDLMIGKRIALKQDEIRFRPSLGMRCAWLFAILALAGNLLLLDSKSYVMILADVLMVAEVLRTFPGTIAISDEGIRYFSVWRRSSLKWEDVYSAVQRRSDYRVYGRLGQRLTIYRAYYVDYRSIVSRIAASLRSKSVLANSPEPTAVVDIVHQWVSIVSFLVIAASFLGMRF